MFTEDDDLEFNHHYFLSPSLADISTYDSFPGYQFIPFAEIDSWFPLYNVISTFNQTPSYKGEMFLKVDNANINQTSISALSN